MVSAGVKTGLNIRGNRNINLGADLVSTAVGAAKEYPMPCVIVSFGTATTFVALDEKGTLLGTSIAPGLQTSLEALREKAARLPEIELDAPGGRHRMRYGAVYEIWYFLRNCLYVRWDVPPF